MTRTDILSDQGYVFLGSRLKRLAERLQADVSRIGQDMGYPVQPSQITLLATIGRDGPLTVSDAVAALGVSQPAVTRNLNMLKRLGLVTATSAAADRRQKALDLTPQGRAMLEGLKRDIWPRVGGAVAEVCGRLSGSLLDQIGALEAELDRLPLNVRASALSIIEFSDALARDFHDINAEWIETMFAMESADREVLEHPRKKIVDPGGAILFVGTAGLGIVGTCALRKSGEDCFELTKMGVRASARGLKAGEYLLAHTIERARTLGAKRLYLLTNRKCAAAIHLYEKAGFVHDAQVMAEFGGRYARSDVAMSYPIAA